MQFFSSPSDLMSSIVVDKSWSTTTARALFQRETTYILQCPSMCGLFWALVSVWKAIYCAWVCRLWFTVGSSCLLMHLGQHGDWRQCCSYSGLGEFHLCFTLDRVSRSCILLPCLYLIMVPCSCRWKAFSEDEEVQQLNSWGWSSQGL